MKDMKEIKTTITSLLFQNTILKNVISEKDRIIEELMYKVENLQNDLEYSKVNGGINKLVLKRN